MTKKQRSYKILILIAAQKQDEKVQELFSDVPVQYHIYAKGTASGDMADLLGLGNIDKTVTVSMLPDFQADKMLTKLKNALYLGTPNSGVAFTIPVSGSSAGILQLLEGLENDKEERNVQDNMKKEYVMIMAFVNQGFSEEVMAAAKPAGAGGGTVFHSRRVGGDEALHLWGINIQEEREVVLILAKKDYKTAIMKAITEKCGVQTEAHGMVISLPVDSVKGLNKEVQS